MLFRKSATLLLFIFILSIAHSTAFPAKPGREIIIEGLKIFNQNEIKKILKLDEYQAGLKSGRKAANAITVFYQKNGYSMIKVSIIEDSSERLALYVNEGRLGKIIIHGLNNYYSLKVKQLIDFPGKIYNTEILEQNIARINRKYRFRSIRSELHKIADYSDSLFQLDRDLKKIALIYNNLRIFNDFPPEYDLHFYPERGSDLSGPAAGRDGFSFNIDYDYPSEIIPEVSYYKNNAFYGKDYFEIDVSSGFDAGLGSYLSYPPDYTPDLKPERTFSRVDGEYKFNPYKKDFFGPVIKGRLYQSRSSREDLEIEEYHYLQSKITFAPELTFLKYFNIYAGFGYEQVYFYNMYYTANPDGNSDTPVKRNNGIDNYPFFESRIKLDPIPIRIGNRIDKYIVFTYTEYFGNSNSRELQIVSAYDFEFSNLSIYSLKFRSDLYFLDTPFHHNTDVNSQIFKGFSRDSYYTNREFSLSNEYRFSIYQDYIYAGGFMDCVVFEPEGYQISGNKYGIAAGPTGRILFYDQFEFIFYYSLDRLYPDKTNGTNLQVKFRKKW